MKNGERSIVLDKIKELIENELIYPPGYVERVTEILNQPIEKAPLPN